MNTKISFDTNWEEYLNNLEGNFILITDDIVFNIYKRTLSKYSHIVIKHGEKSKSFNTIIEIVNQLIKFEVDRTWNIIGFGGGVVTDIAGFVASIYMRGIKFSFIPTSLLSMVDASIGGKNGINFNQYKNLIGCFNNPKNIIIDVSLLHTLPNEEWINGFAEIIKHACIRDNNLFFTLEKNNVNKIKNNPTLLSKIVKVSSNIKVKVVKQDWQETRLRKILNFGHTFGHAIETTHNLPHGKAISLGMIIALELSVNRNILNKESMTRIVELLKKYDLTTSYKLDKGTILNTLILDKKREKNSIHLILLNEIGKSVVKEITLKDLESFFKPFNF